MQLCDDGPGDFRLSSTVYVWHDPSHAVSRGLHLAPSGVCKEELDLGTVTRIAYATLHEAQVLPDHHAFVMLHYIPDAEEAHVTMLPVGAKTRRDEIDALLRSEDGFRGVLGDAVELCRGDQGASSVKLLYDDPVHVRDSTKLAVVHDLHAVVDLDLVAGFLGCVAPLQS